MIIVHLRFHEGRQGTDEQNSENDLCGGIKDKSGEKGCGDRAKNQQRQDRILRGSDKRDIPRASPPAYRRIRAVKSVA